MSCSVMQKVSNPFSAKAVNEFLVFLRPEPLVVLASVAWRLIQFNERV